MSYGIALLEWLMMYVGGKGDTNVPYGLYTILDPPPPYHVSCSRLSIDKYANNPAMYFCC
jgi:hypothetical protein